MPALEFMAEAKPWPSDTDQASGRIAEHCGIDNKTKDDCALTLIGMTEPYSMSHRRGRDTIGGEA
jgi:hypothetical protein